MSCVTMEKVRRKLGDAENIFDRLRPTDEYLASIVCHSSS